MQEPDSELAGKAQLVKSARIWESALSPVVPHTLLAEISCSLCAYSAQESAHNGVIASPLKLHGVIEFCTMALHITLAVYLA